MCVYQVVICRILYTHRIDNSLRYVFETSKMVAIQKKKDTQMSSISILEIKIGEDKFCVYFFNLRNFREKATCNASFSGLT